MLNYRRRLLMLLLAFFLIAALSLIWGQIDMPLSAAAAVLGYQFHLPGFAPDGFSFEQQAVLWYIRLPRVLSALLTGAALAVAGAVMQAVFGNSLADPGMVGASSGASTGAVLAIASGAGALHIAYMPLLAFGGAVCAVALTVALAKRQGKIPVMTLLLAGIAVSALLGAVNAAVLTYMNEQKLQQYLFWMVGGLDFRRWEHVGIAFGPVSLGMLTLFCLSRQLNILALGEDQARAVGMAAAPLRLVFLLLASLITAAAVCISGNIGFVGLVIPHLVRMLTGPDHRRLLPGSALAGAMFLLICDTLGRSLLFPHEIRVGIMTASLGAPYFLYRLRQVRRL